MLNELLALSAAFTVAATVLLLVGGRLEVPGRLSRVVVVAGLALALGYVSGHPLTQSLPANPGDPLVLVATAVLVLSLLTPGRWWAIGSVAFASLVVAIGIYLAYLARVTFVLAGGPLGLAFGLLLLAFEFLALVLAVLSVFEMIDALCGRVDLPKRPPAPARWPVVALQVPTYAEPPDLVIETLRSLTRLDYPSDRLVIQVIDNNTTDPSLWRPLEAECHRLVEEGHRVLFGHLEEWRGFKAGALNWGTAHLPADVEILVILDADYEVDPGFLLATVPFFEDPTVAFVQTPQEYREWEKSAFYRACHAGLAYFFKIGMVSRAFRNSIIFAGTMGLIRRRVLEEIGGWDQEIITEDAEASLRMLAHGYRGIYVPRAYGRGIMPLTYESLRKQRFRWSFGGIQILRKHWRELLPWSKSGLNQRQRRDYLLGGLWWFNDLLTLGFLLFIALTALGVLLNRPFVVQLLSGPALVLPLMYLVLGLVRFLWGLRIAAQIGLVEAAAALRVNLSLAWVVTMACLRALVETHGVFLRTPKFAGSDTARSLRVVWVETLLATLAGVLAVAVLFKAGLSTLTLTIDTLLLWSVLIYGSATNYALGDPQRPPQSLRRKAAQQLLDGPVRRAVGGTGLVAAGIAFGFILAVATQAGRAPVSSNEVLTPPAEPIAPPIISGAIPSPSPSPSHSPSVAPSQASPSASPSVAPSPSANPSPSPSPRASASPTASPPASATPQPTPTLSAAPSATPRPTPTSPPTSPPASASPSPPASPAIPGASAAPS